MLIDMQGRKIKNATENNTEADFLKTLNLLSNFTDHFCVLYTFKGLHYMISNASLELQSEYENILKEQILREKILDTLDEYLCDEDDYMPEDEELMKQQEWIEEIIKKLDKDNKE